MNSIDERDGWGRWYRTFIPETTLVTQLVVRPLILLHPQRIIRSFDGLKQKSLWTRRETGAYVRACGASRSSPVNHRDPAA